jgi:quinol monooxygenase YgiN
VDTPWKALKGVENGREYVALLSYLPLRSYAKIPAFLRFTLQIQRQMRETPGAVGYALRAKILSRDFWTLSVWEDDHALMDFVGKVPHAEAMKSMAPHMGATRFTRWKLQSSAIPPSWDEAMRREAQEK